MFAVKYKLIILKTLVLLLEFLALALVVYLLVAPYFVLWRYKYFSPPSNQAVFQDVSQVKAQVSQTKQDTKVDLSGNRLIITKINVNAPIVEGDSEAALNYGAWRWPQSSQPDLGANTVITGHRFKYLPPNNLTFYLFDQLAVNDIVTVIWDQQEYYYVIEEIKVVDKYEVSILEPTEEPVLTLFTCHPLFSEDSRLVIRAKLLAD